MREIATLIPEDEFNNYLKEIKQMVDIWKEEGLGYISCTCQTVDFLKKLPNDNMVFTVGQLKKIFELAK